MPADEERQQRILDAAARLFVHYGYDKTTVSEIAQAAGVSKGAIYLHFKSKDDLFETLLIREMKAFAEEWLLVTDQDPRGGTIAAMYRNMLYALSANPFMSAIFRQDSQIFGSYLRKPGNLFRAQSFSGTRHEFVQMMQEAGAVRSDIDPAVIAHVMNMLAYGLISMENIMAKEDIPPLDDVIEGISLLMDRALTPAGGADSEAGKAIIRQISDAARRRFEEGDYRGNEWTNT